MTGKGYSDLYTDTCLYGLNNWISKRKTNTGDDERGESIYTIMNDFDPTVHREKGKGEYREQAQRGTIIKGIDDL